MKALKRPGVATRAFLLRPRRGARPKGWAWGRARPARPRPGKIDTVVLVQHDSGHREQHTLRTKTCPQRKGWKPVWWRRKNATCPLVGLGGQPQRKPEAHTCFDVEWVLRLFARRYWGPEGKPRLASLEHVRGRFLALVLGIRWAFVGLPLQYMPDAAINTKHQMIVSLVQRFRLRSCSRAVIKLCDKTRNFCSEAGRN